MSLRGRLLIIIVLLNLAVIAVVQVTALWAHRDRVAAQRDLYQRLLQNLVADASRPRERIVDARWVRQLLRLESFRRVFRDVMVTTGGFGRTVALNPMGAAQLPMEPASQQTNLAASQLPQPPGK